MLVSLPAPSFFRELAYTGGSVPLPADRDIAKFESEAVSWLTPTHTTFMVHEVALAVARGAAKATKEYCMRRVADDYIVCAVAAAPPLVPRPDSDDSE